VLSDTARAIAAAGAIILAVVVLAACSERSKMGIPGEDFGSPIQTDEVSKAPVEQRTPVVVVPGMLGSRLINERGEPVWDDLLSFSKRFLELEYPRGPTGGPLRPVGLMVKDFFFGDLQGGNYAGLLSMLAEAGFNAGEDLFVFPYDWRQSNFETARQLAAFVDSQERLKGKRFNILAHSMGGLVAIIYVHRHADPARVNQVITLATPYWGSLDALRAILYGPRDIYNNVFSRLVGVKRGDVNRVMLSFPSLYELMPSYDDCCEFGTASSPATGEFSVLDARNWSRLGWLPAEYTDQRALERIATYMVAARELRELVQKPLPKGVRVHRFAGDLFETNVRVAVTGYIEDYVWTRGAGDDTVWWPSALAGYKEFRVPAAKPHNTIFDDSLVRQAIVGLLLGTGVTDDAVPIAMPTAPTVAGVQPSAVQAKRGKVYVAALKAELTLDRVSMSIGTPYKIAGSSFTVEVRLLGDDNRPIKGAELAGVLSSHDRNWEVQEFRFDSTGHYRATFKAPVKTDTYGIHVTVPGFGEVAKNFAVIGEDG
jgi:pimeloyl-ACP methyl ester carboxylesterase